MHKIIYCSIISIVKCWKWPKYPEQRGLVTWVPAHARSRTQCGWTLGWEVARKHLHGIWLVKAPRAQMDIKCSLTRKRRKANWETIHLSAYFNKRNTKRLAYRRSKRKGGDGREGHSSHSKILSNITQTYTSVLMVYTLKQQHEINKGGRTLQLNANRKEWVQLYISVNTTLGAGGGKST